MKNRSIGILSVMLFLLLSVAPAAAIPLISIDMDPSVLGIQNSLTVDPGDIFAVDIVFTGDGATTFDTIMLDVAFNDMGSQLAWSGGPTTGTLAGTAPIFALDIFGGFATFPGNALTTALNPVSPGYTAGIGGVGLASMGIPFPVVGAGTTIDIFDLTFQATTPGTTTISALGFPMGFELALVGATVPTLLAPGNAVVTPEPATMFLLGTGIIGLAGLRKKFRRI
jgi:hypothetical protein